MALQRKVKVRTIIADAEVVDADQKSDFEASNCTPAMATASGVGSAVKTLVTSSKSTTEEAIMSAKDQKACCDSSDY